jgi:hypothetical protein
MESVEDKHTHAQNERKCQGHIRLFDVADTRRERKRHTNTYTHTELCVFADDVDDTT